MLRHLAANKSASAQFAAIGDAGDDFRHGFGLQLADRDVVEEEQRLSAGGEDVVDAHGDQIDADGVVLARHLRQLDLRSHAIGSRHEDRIGHLLRDFDREQAAESADVAANLVAIRTMNRILDGVYRASALCGVDARFGVRG